MPKTYYHVEAYQARRSIGYLLRRAGTLVTAHIEELFTEEDVSFLQWMLMMNLREGLAHTAAELRDQVCHDSGALTRVIDQLEERGFISRQRSTTDRRAIELKLTAQGANIVNSYLPRVIGLYNTLMEDFTAEEADTLITLLTRLTTKLAGQHTQGGQ